MTVKEELREIVESLDDERAVEALNYLRRLLSEGDPRTAREVDGERPGEFWKRGKRTSGNDPLWELVGIIGPEYDVPTDLSVNHDKYLAEIYADLHDE